jgi:hypothetical protein
VPEHPQTGEVWAPAGSAAYRVPLPFGVWLWLARPEPSLPVPATGRLPEDVLREDPPAPHPGRLFRADLATFDCTLARLRAVRGPWLREILDDLTPHRTDSLF